MDAEQEETIEIIIGTLKEVVDQGYAVCKICNAQIYGDDLGEILEAMGEHGEQDHDDVRRA